MPNINNCITTDIVIVGGGIAGLMLQNKLDSIGYSTLLLEQDKLGAGQTAKSQGIIHGGIKYALLGQVTDAAHALASMPDRWQQYFNNTNLDKLDLSETQILSKHHILWNNGDIRNRLKQVLMQKSLSSTGCALEKIKYPDIFKHQNFKGNVYQINETVVDVYSLLDNLSKPHKNKIIKIDQDSLKIFLNNKKEINNITFNQNGDIFNIAAQQYIFTAGSNNQIILDLIPHLPKMQLRPLHMVLAKFPEPNILYGHYVGNGILPQLTITTHKSHDGEYIWYIGGKIAETGIYLNSKQQIVQAKVEINNVFPWLDTSHWQWATTTANRAEPLQTNNIRPDTALVTSNKNATVAWPTKLAMTPIMVDNTVHSLLTNNIKPQFKQTDINDYNLQSATIVEPFWEELFVEEPA